MKALSVVIPNWNGAAILRRCLPSVVAAAEAYPGEAETVVVDDGSTDDSVAVLASEFPSVRVVRHEVNRGFGAACLTGVQAAAHPVVVLLNSDVRVEPDFLTPLQAPFERPEVFSASPLIFDEEGHLGDVTLTVPYVRRGKIRFRSIPTHQLRAPGAAAAGPWYTFFPLGGAVAFDRARFLELGGFDDLYAPFYYEDIDLGFCAWRRGWTCEVVPNSTVFHEGAGTIGRAFKRARVRTIRKRNRVLFHVKNLTATVPLLTFLVQHPLRVLLGLLRLDFAQALGALLALPRLLRALRRRRAERQAEVHSPEAIFTTIDTRWAECTARLQASPGDGA